LADEDLSKLKIDKARITGPRRSRKRLYYVLAAVILAGAILFSYAKGLFSIATQVDVATVSQVYPSQTFTLLNASGYVVAQRKSSVASKVTGKIVSLLVEEGSRIKQGDIIARLENSDTLALEKQAVANLESTRSNLDQAKAELRDSSVAYARERELLAEDSTSRASHDAAEARYKKAVAGVAGAEHAIRANSAALENARVTIEYTYIRAPFDAIVLTKNADVGDIVTPLGAAANAKAAVVTIADMDSLQVEADVSESNIQKIKVGQPCEIQLDAVPDTRFRGAIHMIVPTADRSKATVMVKVRFVDKDARVLPEMSARVAFLSRPVGPKDEKARTLISNKTLIKRNGKSAVFLVKGDHAVEALVTTGEVMGAMTEVLSGIKVGDKVVTNPPDKLKNGSRIKVAE
jgi:RND family efflux transporter MFP subunit